MTKDEAEKKLAEYRQISLGFCPVIRATCRRDCASYIEPRVVQTIKYNFATAPTEADFFAQEGYCVSPLVTGTCEFDPA